MTHRYRLRQIIQKYEKPEAEMFEVTTSRGRKIICTKGHRFLTGSGWKYLRDIAEGDYVKVHNSSSVRGYSGGVSNATSRDEERVIKIRPVGIRKVWDIQVAEDASYLAHGFVNHNSSPNLQQIPRDGLIKKLFTSRFGVRGGIYQADLSQIELRLLAAACGDPTMVKAYVDGVDLHSLTTSLVFKLPYEHFTEPYELFLQNSGKADEAKKLKSKRKIGKTLNFLTGYGGGALGFQSALALQGIYLQLEECEAHLNGFFENYPFLKTHIGLYKNFIQQHGLAVSLTGRVRVLEEVYSEDRGISNRALRAGYNHVIQSTASDIMLLCLVAIEQLMRDENLESLLVSTVHDSLVIDATWEELPKIHEIVNGVLSNIPEVVKILLGPEYDASWLDVVPLAGDSSVGKNYSQEFKIPANPDWAHLKALCLAPT